MQETEFVELMRSWLVSLPHDVRIASEAVDDENLSRSDRELAAAAVLDVVGKYDPVKNRRDPIASFADDIVVLRLALAKIASKTDEDTVAFTDRFPELFESLASELSLAGPVIGDMLPVFQQRVDALPSQVFKGKKMAAFIDEDDMREDLQDRVITFRTDYPLDEETIVDKLKKSATVLDAFRKAASALAS